MFFTGTRLYKTLFQIASDILLLETKGSFWSLNETLMNGSSHASTIINIGFSPIISYFLLPFLLLTPLMIDFSRGSFNVCVCGLYSLTYIMPLGLKSSCRGQNDWADAAKITAPK